MVIIITINMISESCNNEQIVMDQVKENKSFGFIKLYKSAAETKEHFDTNKWSKKVKKLNKNSQPELDSIKLSRSSSKGKKQKESETIGLTNTEDVERSSSKTRSSKKLNVTSTKSEYLNSGVKSIMKNTSCGKDFLNVSNVSTPSSKPKKRNKSVSFMLEDADEVVMKKSKANDLSKDLKNVDKKMGKKEKSRKQKKKESEKIIESKENQNINENILTLKKKQKLVPNTVVRDEVGQSTLNLPITEELHSGMKKKAKKSKPECEKGTDNNVTEEQTSENKPKKLKKKKRKAKCIQDSNTDVDGEPAIKTRKKDLKPEVIAKGLENLNIGDNAHTLTNLLDEMTVVDKNKKKIARQKQNSKKHKNTGNSDDKQEAPHRDNNTEENEKVKWRSRKWNKGARGDIKLRLHTSVVVENLPLRIMCSYKTLLSEYFGKFGTIAGIGVAETYPIEDLKPVFTTTVFFQEEDAASKALDEDNTLFEGNRIRVRRPQPPTETTLVVRAYALSDQALSSLFSSAGRIRAIRQMIKGKKSMPTAFVEFDGPEAVERALQLAEDAKINGKKMYVSKFEIRNKGKLSSNEKNSTNGRDSDSSTE